MQESINTLIENTIFILNVSRTFFQFLGGLSWLAWLFGNYR